MLLLDIYNMDIDKELNHIVDKSDLIHPIYLIMSKDTFIIFKKMSIQYSKKGNAWLYSGDKYSLIVDYLRIAIDKAMTFGEVVVR